MGGAGRAGAGGSGEGGVEGEGEGEGEQREVFHINDQMRIKLFNGILINRDNIKCLYFFICLFMVYFFVLSRKKRAKLFQRFIIVNRTNRLSMTSRYF